VDPTVLRDGVLGGVTVVAAGAGELGGAVRERVAALGAAVAERAVDPWGEEVAFEGAADVLVYDGAAVCAEGIRAVLDGAWLTIRPVATAAMIDRGGGLIVLLAPRPGSPEAEAARAGLENLARTLSVEWARFAVRPVAILPGEATSSAEVAELAAFLASPAGAYYSGCAFTLGAVATPE
jgi:NAD(P)-dependent dehydrogenase (short-subunit alcohol dehydrogenase family)